MNEIMEALSKSPDLLKEIYGDLAKPGVVQAGRAIGGLVGLGNTVLLPVHLINARSQIYLENNLEKFREQAARIADEDVTEVPPEVGVPILEKLTYVSNEELSEMYVNLLAKASSSKHHNLAHPGFVKVIESLSPDEGIFLKKLKDKYAVPFIEIRLNNQKKNEWQSLADYVVSGDLLEGLTSECNFSSYLSNLDSLGIIKIRRDIFMTPREAVYRPIWEEHKAKYLALDGMIPDHQLGYEVARADVTPFGQLFISACHTTLGE